MTDTDFEGPRYIPATLTKMRVAFFNTKKDSESLVPGDWIKSLDYAIRGAWGGGGIFHGIFHSVSFGFRGESLFFFGGLGF